MSLSTRISGLRAKIKRLEATARKGQRYCVFCRWYLRFPWDDPDKTPSLADRIKARCEFCGSEYEVNLANIPEEDREVTRLDHTFKIEDQYTNPKAYALNLWLALRPKHKKRRGQRPMVKGKAKNNHALARLKEEIVEVLARTHKNLKAKYGDPFPEILELLKSLQSRKLLSMRLQVLGLYELEVKETDHLICAELEKIIWREITPRTAAALEKIRQEIEELTGVKEARLNAEARRKTLEAVNRNRARLGRPPLTSN